MLKAIGQMLMCVVLGFIQIRYSCGLFASRPSVRAALSTPSGYKFTQPSMVILGTLRYFLLSSFDFESTSNFLPYHQDSQRWSLVLRP